MSYEFDEYLISKWSRLVRIRDEFTCAMCRRTPPRRRLQSHHIHPKSKYPERAYDLSNGVSLCVSCHICVVHAETTFDIGNYLFYVPAFRRYVGLSKQRKFNKANQHRLVRRKK